MTLADEALGPVRGLPSLGSPGEISLPPVALAYWRVHAAVFGAVGASVAPLLFAWLWPSALNPWGWIGSVVIVVVTLFEVLAYLPFRYKHYSYTVGSDFVYIARGRLLRRSVLIPGSKVVNISSTQGPIMRRMRVTELGITSLLHVDNFGPFPADLADRIKDRILAGSNSQEGK